MPNGRCSTTGRGSHHANAFLRRGEILLVAVQSIEQILPPGFRLVRTTTRRLGRELIEAWIKNGAHRACVKKKQRVHARPDGQGAM